MAKITFTGDIMCSPRMTQVANGDFSPVLAHAKKLADCDYLVGNLETPIAGETLRYTHDRYCFNSPAAYLTALKEGGFDLFSLANNHCMDRGEEGILNTLAACREAGFDTVGLYETEADRDRIFVKELDGIRVAFLAYTYGTNAFYHKRFLDHPYMVNLIQPEETLPGSIHLLLPYSTIGARLREIYLDRGEEYPLVVPYLERLQNDIARAKREADYVIVLMHNGGQNITEIDPYSAYIAERVKEWGADLIVGNHQHVIQPSEYKDGYLKIFCLGNLIYDQRVAGDGWHVDTPVYSAVYHLDLARDADGNIKAKHSFSIYMTVTDESGLPALIDAYDVYRTLDEAYLRTDLVHYANLFAGGAKTYTDVQEVYEL